MCLFDKMCNPALTHHGGLYDLVTSSFVFNTQAAQLSQQQTIAIAL